MSNYQYDSAAPRSLLRSLRELLRWRELLGDLVTKELRVRYRVAVMGFFWAILYPLAMMAILTFVFGIVMRGGRIDIGANQREYAVMLLCALIPWQFLSQSLNAATDSLLSNQELIKKVNFSREVVPIAAVLDWGVNLFIGVILLLIVHALFGGTFALGQLWIVPLFVIQLTLVMGAALLFSALNVIYRDVKHIVDIALVFAFYASPIFYPLEWVQTVLSGEKSWILPLYLLNPMAGLLTCYRDLLFDHTLHHPGLLVWPAACAAAFLWLGYHTFQRLSPRFADHL